MRENVCELRDCIRNMFDMKKTKKQKKQQPLRDVKSNDEKGVYKTRVT